MILVSCYNIALYMDISRYVCLFDPEEKIATLLVTFSRVILTV